MGFDDFKQEAVCRFGKVQLGRDASRALISAASWRAPTSSNDSAASCHASRASSGFPRAREVWPNSRSSSAWSSRSSRPSASNIAIRSVATLAS